MKNVSFWLLLFYPLDNLDKMVFSWILVDQGFTKRINENDYICKFSEDNER